MNENINNNDFIEVEVISEKIEKIRKVSKKLTKQEKNSLIFSIISLISFFIPYFGFFINTFAFIFSMNLIVSDKKSKIGIISLIISIIGTILNISLLLFL